ncbi:hypothetical protein NDU88_008952 [Pleurodeles waltl]|uniref:Uncharacterized protein n=1 Tax=Pleurodeles waltl TaxID=8319 RepID=A0AAV7PT96_PLEWA|nr:hypothetical protein NDU88_008952 [Pleurodeles waltl]
MTCTARVTIIDELITGNSDKEATPPPPLCLFRLSLDSTETKKCRLRPARPDSGSRHGQPTAQRAPAVGPAAPAVAFVKAPVLAPDAAPAVASLKAPVVPPDAATAVGSDADPAVGAAARVVGSAAPDLGAVAVLVIGLEAAGQIGLLKAPAVGLAAAPAPTDSGKCGAFP